MKDLDFIDDFFEDHNHKKLHERIAKVKNEMLFEEPCPLYEDDHE